MKRFLSLILLTALTMTGLSAFAQEVLTEVPATTANSICMAETCLTGVTALILTIVTGLVTAATIILKFVDKDSWIGRQLDRIANLKINTDK